MKTLVKKKFKQLFSIGKRALQITANNKKMAILVFVNLLFIGLILYAKPVLAVDGAGTIAQIGDYLGTFITSIFMGLSEFFIKMALFFLQYFIAIAGWNSYLDVPTVMLGWTMVRDVANMFFVVILLVIAFGTILGIEQYQWNKLLVKLILSAIFINFSNLICGIFIDIAHVFTITFVNAVSATAGGNFIQAFKLSHLQKIVPGAGAEGNEKFDIRLLVGALAAMLFAIVAMCIIAAYAIVMLARMIVLWVLVILSPLAFILQVLPNTQSYAKQWWDKFAKQVIVAPIMVFFLWLTFATAGSGNIATEIKLNIQERPGEAMPATSLSESTTWGNMASFFIPLALMMAGIGVVQQMGVVGGGVVQSAMGVAKKIAGYATGYNAARWTGGKVVAGAKAVALAPVRGVGLLAKKTVGEAVGDRWKIEKAAAKRWYYGKAIEPGGGFIGKMARGRISRRKRLGKTETLAKQIEDMAFKRSSSKAGGMIIGRKRETAMGEHVEDENRYWKGALEAEESRSSAKDKAIMSQGKKKVLEQERFKDGEYQEGDTMQEQIDKNLIKARITEGEIEKMSGDIKVKILRDDKPGGMADRLGTVLGDVEMNNETIQGWEQSAMYGKLRDKYAEDKTKIDKGISENETVEDAKARQEGIESEITLAQDVFESSQNEVMTMIDNMDVGDAVKEGFKEAWLAARDRGFKVEREDGESDEAYNIRVAGVIKDSFDDEIEKKTSISDVDKMKVSNTFTDDGAQEKVTSILRSRSEISKKSQEHNEEAKVIAGEKQKVIEDLTARGEIPAWEASRAQAMREHNSSYYRSARKTLLSDASQAYIWDKHGIVTPNDGEEELIESTSNGTFKDMNFEMTLAAYQGHKKMIAEKRKRLEEKKKRGEDILPEDEITFEDKVVGMALHRKLFHGGWIDDKIPIAQVEVDQFFKDMAGAGEGSPEFARMKRMATKVIGGVGHMTEDKASNMKKLFKEVFTGSEAVLKSIMEGIEKGDDIDQYIIQFSALLKNKIGSMDSNTVKGIFGADAKNDKGAEKAKQIVDMLKNLHASDNKRFESFK